MSTDTNTNPPAFATRSLLIGATVRTATVTVPVGGVPHRVHVRELTGAEAVAVTKAAAGAEPETTCRAIALVATGEDGSRLFGDDDHAVVAGLPGSVFGPLAGAIRDLSAGTAETAAGK